MVFQGEANDTMKGHYRIDYDDGWAGLWQQLRADNAGSALTAFTCTVGSPLPYGEKTEEGNVTLKLPTPVIFRSVPAYK